MIKETPDTLAETKPVAPKRILIMGHSTGQGGAQTAFKKLCAFTTAEGHDVKIIVLSNSNLQHQPFNRRELLGKIAYTGSKYILPVRKAMDVLFLARKVIKFKPEIFITVGLNNSSNLIARVLGKGCFKVAQDFIANRTLEDPVWRSSQSVMDGLVVQAPSMLSHWQNLGTDTSKVNWLPCFPEKPVEGVLKQARNTSSKEIKLSYFGRLAGNKGLDLLLYALADPNTPKNICLDLWGQGQEKSALQQLVIKLQLQDQIRFLGSYPGDQEGAALMASYDAMVLCSTGMEGLPLILLESMAYGIPFLATNVGAISDCCINNPDTILVNPTKESISNGIKQLVQKIEMEQFDAQRHRKFYDQTFSHQVMARRWRTFYNNPKDFFYAS